MRKKTIVVLDPKGRLLLPSEIRKKIAARRFVLRFKDEKLELEPLPAPKSVRGKYRGLLKVSREELEEAQERFLLER